MVLTGLLAVGCGSIPLAGSFAGSASAAPAAAPSRPVIVLLKDSASSDAVASEHARTRRASVKHVYGAALQGYAASVPDDQLAALRQDPRV